MQAEELEMQIKSGKAPLLLDVRSGLEFKSGHIAGAVHAPLTKLLKTTVALSQSKQESLVITCEHGPRAQVARMLLKLNGYKNVALLDGHMALWRGSGRSVKKVS